MDQTKAAGRRALCCHVVAECVATDNFPAYNASSRLKM